MRGAVVAVENRRNEIGEETNRGLLSNRIQLRPPTPAPPNRVLVVYNWVGPGQAMAPKDRVQEKQKKKTEKK